ncbi:PREDICTED: CREB-regulated transcription coactivator 1-like isoform X2 [Priapulus caudatus]|uniref:CREB-regulated transcription coactivator 1-like isoform X2 n=1 Tax=Priapulus caudatus TaxID=37621 RepID=A0ABM1EH56_PRICU|nr:PREDICTED: CREB-regulated transcription coactivator 1-like isoform X2 [Priapulus caudatus]
MKDVSRITKTNTQIQNVSHLFDESQQSRQALVERVHRGRQMVRHRPFDKRLDVSPYHLQPPDTSWRRTHSDSAIHTSGLMAPSSQCQLAAPPAQRRVGDSMNNLYPMLWEPRKPYQFISLPPQPRSKSCEVPGINIYEYNSEHSSEQTSPVMTSSLSYIPLSAGSSLPDLTNIQLRSSSSSFVADPPIADGGAPREPMLCSLAAPAGLQAAGYEGKWPHAGSMAYRSPTGSNSPLSRSPTVPRRQQSPQLPDSPHNNAQYTIPMDMTLHTMVGIMDQQAAAPFSYPPSTLDASPRDLTPSSLRGSSPRMMSSASMQQQQQQPMSYGMSQPAVSIGAATGGGYAPSTHGMTLPLSRSYTQKMTPGGTYAQTSSPGVMYAQTPSPGPTYAQAALPGPTYSQVVSPGATYSQAVSPGATYSQGGVEELTSKPGVVQQVHPQVNQTLGTPQQAASMAYRSPQSPEHCCSPAPPSPAGPCSPARGVSPVGSPGSPYSEAYVLSPQLARQTNDLGHQLEQFNMEQTSRSKHPSSSSQHTGQYSQPLQVLQNGSVNSVRGCTMQSQNNNTIPDIIIDDLGKDLGQAMGLVGAFDPDFLPNLEVDQLDLQMLTGEMDTVADTTTGANDSFHVNRLQ